MTNTKNYMKCPDCNRVFFNLNDLIDHERENGHGTWGPGWWAFQRQNRVSA